MKKTILATLGGAALLTAVAGALAYGLSSTGKAPAAGPEPASAYHKLFATGVLSGVHVLDLKTGKRLAYLDTGAIPHNLLVSPDGKRVYVSNVGSQSVSEIDAASARKLKDILVGEIPHNAYHDKLDPRKLAAATTCYGCHRYEAVGTLPNAMAWAGDGRSLLVTEAAGRAVSWLDPAQGKTVKRMTFDLPTPSTPASIAVDPHSHEVWVLHRFEPLKKGEKKGTRNLSMGGFDHEPPAGQHVSWVTVYDAQMQHEIARIKTNWAVPFGYAFSPDGHELYVAYRSSNVIAVFDTATKQLKRSFEVGATPTGLAISPDGRELYTACVFMHPAAIQVIDAQTGAIKTSMGVPPSPSLLRVDPRTGHLFATLTGTNSVIEIDPRQQVILHEYPAGHQTLDLVLTP